MIPEGSLLLDLPQISGLLGAFEPDRLCYPWKHPDPEVDQLQEQLESMVRLALREGRARSEIFARAWELSGVPLGGTVQKLPEAALAEPRGPIPYLTEPWFC